MKEKEIDYKAVGLKVGLEIHQQLKTERKLFCYCPARLIRRDPDFKIVRYMRPTLSETGEIDPAALKEFKKRRKIVYEGYYDVTCLYEIDDVPPYQVNYEALKIALMLAKMFNMIIPDALPIMRKQYLDGSVPTGFQRTIIVGLNGYIPLKSGKKLRIIQLCLEEDAARKVKEDKESVTYRLDRLGIPLVEITTDVMDNPDDVLDAALRIGAILRVTGKVRRGIGTIRQDINISIEGGARVEIKGVQRPEWFKPLIDNEIKRQLALIEIAKELKNRGTTKEELRAQKFVDVTSIFKETRCSFISKAIKRGEIVLAVKLPKFGGLLKREIQPGKTFGKEFAERVKAIVGLAGIIHTDELPKYGISEKEKQELFKIMNADPKIDAVVFVVGPKHKVESALEEVIERAEQALDGVPPETRAANPDGTTTFERPLPGRARMYPDTDLPPIRISEELLEEAEKMKAPYPWELEEKFVKEYGLHEAEAKQLVIHERLPLFLELVQLGIKPKLAARTILVTMKSLRRDGYPVDELPDEKIIEIFKKVKSGAISKEAIPDLLMILSKNKELSIDDAIKKLGVKKISIEELRKLVKQIISQRIDYVKQTKERAFKGIMGEVMKQVRGAIDGKTVAQIVREELQKILNTL